MPERYELLKDACEELKNTGRIYTHTIILAPFGEYWEVVSLIDGEPVAAGLGLVSDPHYAADSDHTPLTPAADCADCAAWQEAA